MSKVLSKVTIFGAFNVPELSLETSENHLGLLAPIASKFLSWTSS
jgi:hypothetical protein